MPNPIPVPNRQLRRHMFTIQPGHIIHKELLALSTPAEKNQFFQEWWEQFKLHEQPDHVRYLAASLELTPERCKKTGKLNENRGLLHVNGVVFWKKQVRFSQQYNNIGIPSCSLMVIQNPHHAIDYCTASGSQSDKDHIEIHEVMPTGNRPHQGVRSRQALTDDMIDRIKSGQGLTTIWRQNPRIVAHFGLKRLRDMIELHEFCSEPSVTGFQATETVATITPSPKRVSREDSVPRLERDTDSFASRSRDECFSCETLGPDVCHIHGPHLRSSEEE